MSAPLAPGYVETPLWHAGVVGTEVAHAPLPTRADVVVVGGGYCGASAAAGLARRGRAVTVLEAGDAGAGASTRNGGMVIPELKHGPRSLRRKHAEVGAQLIAETLEAYALVQQRVEQEAIECDYRPAGGLLLAHHGQHLDGLADLAAEWRDEGEDARFLTRAELAAEIGTGAYDGGMLLTKTAAIQPAKYHAALVADARAAGATVHHHTRATGVERVGARFLVRTSHGSIDAGDVLIAANAYVDGVLPPLERRVLPIGSFIIATEPLGPDVARAVMPGDRMCFDTKHLLNYWRLSPDGRMVFGGRASLSRTTVAKARDVLYQQMVRVHPQLDGARVTHAWGGNVAVTLDRLPHFGRLDGVAFATGCNGTGIALATWLGTRAAAWMTGEEPPPAFASLAFRPIPFRALRDAWLPAAGVALRLGDRLGR